MSERFIVKEERDVFFVIDTLCNKKVNNYDKYDDALSDSKCRNENEGQSGND